ncbi:helix-turn-helix transcriptional regulator [Hafnia alvei]|uniref:Transcriptional regulator, LuxR family n=1 Tax=Hafnia alvei ATCC 51873 TaxID=1002364 RepID=G9YD95_HAFAL|nr:LuxR C-terminal-related transcriptional regulator [Hafnia alvei]EHM37975.1 transcriptional regulator, LuxR family [Hafnia alvei ATCC 51873]QQE43941.1 response regulator transcription factor [Hafnia alvei]
MNIISHTNNLYIESAIHHLVSTTVTDVTLSKLDHIILFNDRSPSESLIMLSEYSEFKLGEIILIVTDVVSPEIVARFIRQKCELIVLSMQSSLKEWLAALIFSPEYRRKTIQCGVTHNPLLTNTEKRFLNGLSMAGTKQIVTKVLEMTAKEVSAYKRNVMRKLGIKHSQQLLNYVNTDNISTVLTFL